MSVVLCASILLRLLALVWSLVVWRRLRDRRIAFLSALLAMMTLRQLFLLVGDFEAGSFSLGANPIELGGLAVSVLAVVAIVELGHYLEQARQATEHVGDREARLSAILNTTVDGIITIDRKGIVETFNPAAETMFGYTASEVIGRNVSMLMTKPDRDDHDGYLERYGRTGEKKVIGIGREVVGRRRDGTEFPLYLGVGERADGSGFTGVLRDLTERKLADEALEQSRRTLATLISNLPGMAYRCKNERDWTIEYASAGSVDLIGYAPEELVGGNVSYADLIHEEDRERVWDEVQHAIEEDSAYQLTYRVTTSDGEARWVAEQGCAVHAADGSVEALEGFITDISDRKRLEEEVLQAQKMEAVGRLAGGIAHDFNNLLMGIVGCARIASKDVVPGSDTEHQVREIQAAAERGAGLTRQLLTFGSRKASEPEPILLDHVIESVETMIRRLLGEDVRLSLELRAGGGPIVADPGQIEQVLLNLAVNARDAMPEGGVLRISTGKHHNDDDLIVLEVADTGTGMDAETRAKAFDPFFTTKKDTEGTGLGLSTVYGIVTQLGGTVQLDSEVGKGTCFRIFLPRTEAEPEAEEVEAESVPTGGGETVLVVEDDRLVRAGVRHILQEQGYQVLLASNGNEALRVCDEHDDGIDLLLTDCIMPGMGGAQLAEAIHEKREGVKALFMSALPHEVLVEQGRLQPGQPTVQKPFKDGELAARIRGLLDGREA